MMIDKRFEYLGLGEYWDNQEDYGLEPKEVTELLNALHEENEERKRAMRIAEYYNEQLLDENKKMKKYIDSISRGGD